MRGTALVALCWLALALESWAQGGPTQFPGPDVNGYQVIEDTDKFQPAPEGYEGATHIGTKTVVGNNPATAGERYTIKFYLSTEVKKCPQADGTVEGKGSFSLTFDSASGKADGTTSYHISMVANAKYKAQVGDDAFVDGPAKADIDYSFTKTGTFRSLNGPLLTLPGENAGQNITINFFVANAQTGDLIPKLGDFAGGDPTKAHYSNSWDTGLVLAYWGGIYYAMAQAHWRTRNMCVQTEFSPPSNTLKLVLGGETKVKTEIKTYAGERVKARYPVIKGYDSVEYTETYSDVGTPLQVTYTAPSKKPSDPTTTLGFKVEATSRAGVTEGMWKVGLGTGWSGLIVYEEIITGDQGGNDLQVWNNSSSTRVTMQIQEGRWQALGFSEMQGMQRTKQPKFPSGFITASSNDDYGTVMDSSDVKLDVYLDKVRGTYTIQAQYAFKKEGKRYSHSCSRDNCRSDEFAFGIAPIPLGMTGKLDDPNHLHGSQSEVGTGVGYVHNGTRTRNLTWDLARQGTSQ